MNQVRKTGNVTSRFRRIIPLLLSLAVTGFTACSAQDDQREFEQQAYQPAETYTETDRGGQVNEQNVDPDDWRTSPFFQGALIVKPAYPNPALTTDEVIIEVEVTTVGPQINGLIARVFWEGGDMRFLDEIDSSPLPFGNEMLSFPARNLSRFEDARGLHRILLFDGGGNLVSYGDVLVE